MCLVLVEIELVERDSKRRVPESRELPLCCPRLVLEREDALDVSRGTGAGEIHAADEGSLPMMALEDIELRVEKRRLEPAVDLQLDPCCRAEPLEHDGIRAVSPTPTMKLISAWCCAWLRSSLKASEPDTQAVAIFTLIAPSIRSRRCWRNSSPE